MQIEALRAGTTHSVSLATLTGLIAFPSFHTSAAILMIWAAWPLAWLRLPVLAVNGAMLAATPVEGAHYLIDMIGGGALALFAIAMTERLVSGRAKRAIRSRETASFPS
jgi:membrane-associated phospholipid phosphatase